MLKKSKVFLSLTMVFIMMVGFSTAFATTKDVQAASVLSKYQQQKIYEAIQNQLVDTYGDSYIFENFTYKIYEEKIVGTDRLVDIDVYVDMTLTRSVSENAFVQGMLDKIDELEGMEKLIAENEIKHLIMDIEEAYNNTRNVQVLYTIKLGNFSMASTEEGFELFSRIDFLEEDESLLTSVDSIKSSREKDEENAFDNGYKAVEEMVNKIQLRDEVSNLEISVSSVQYDRLKARDWARDNRAAEPEYSKANGHGSDCANFVSRAINQGGIPQDVSGNWAHYSNGSTIGAYKYINWFRTGYNNNGGVAPYMVDKGYFYEETSWNKAFAGSIIYNTSASHVGLVTSGDGSNVYYADHSNVKKSGRETLLQTSNDPNFKTFKFYLPYSSILK
ncbi:amidase domain-containing protein [Alkaliphilus transvaalensis]|uniref:amidase domain-containing protein n=1 Tax=Alkaliphilus transvaalensis TaxID=114628 RepID=UPI00047E2FA4|nr:amidase domain-containing protein [Alkaliphilus transvaalensis]